MISNYPILIIMVCSTVCASRSQDTSCQANVPCVILHSCAPYMRVMRVAGNPVKSNIIKFLRSQQCDFELGVPKVCCSWSTIISELFAREQIKPPTEPPPVVTEKPKTTRRPNKPVIFPTSQNHEAMRQKKIEQMNKALIESGVMDFMGFDIFRRRSADRLLRTADVEIR